VDFYVIDAAIDLPHDPDLVITPAFAGVRVVAKEEPGVVDAP